MRTHGSEKLSAVGSRWFGLGIFALSVSLFAGPPRGQEQAPPLLDAAQKEAQRALDKIDAGLATASKKIALTGFSSEEARKVLRDLAAVDPSVPVADIMSLEGRLVTIEPEAFRKSEGATAAFQMHPMPIRPLLSAHFRAVEGFEAVALVHPLLDSKGSLLGELSILLKPESLLGRLFQPMVAGTPWNLWAVDTDGRILYAADPGEIGKNVLKDPAYFKTPGLVEAVRKIVAAGTGETGYELPATGSHAAGKLQVRWVSAGLHGREWRLVLTRRIAEGEGSQVPKAGTAGTQTGAEALKALAKDAGLIAAMKARDMPKVMDIFRRFCGENPGLYSIQWIEASGVSQGGYPPETSLKDYDFRKEHAVKDTATVKVLDSRKETSFEEPLMEGGTGLFHMVPVFDGEAYLGMITGIRSKG